MEILLTDDFDVSKGDFRFVSEAVDAVQRLVVSQAARVRHVEPDLRVEGHSVKAVRRLYVFGLFILKLFLQINSA